MLVVVQEALDNTLDHVLYVWLSLNKLPWAAHLRATSRNAATKRESLEEALNQC